LDAADVGSKLESDRRGEGGGWGRDRRKAKGQRTESRSSAMQTDGDKQAEEQIRPTRLKLEEIDEKLQGSR